MSQMPLNFGANWFLFDLIYSKMDLRNVFGAKEKDSRKSRT